MESRTTCVNTIFAAALPARSPSHTRIRRLHFRGVDCSCTRTKHSVRCLRCCMQLLPVPQHTLALPHAPCAHTAQRSFVLLHGWESLCLLLF